MPQDRTDYGRLKSLLSRSNVQKENQALFQTIRDLINAAENFQNLVLSNFADTSFEDTINETIDSIRAITLREVNTSGSAQSRALSTYVKGMTVFVDINGNASANNITLVGTVNGVVDPVINTDFGFFRVFKNSNGDYNEW